MLRQLVCIIVWEEEDQQTAPLPSRGEGSERQSRDLEERDEATEVQRLEMSLEKTPGTVTSRAEEAVVKDNYKPESMQCMSSGGLGGCREARGMGDETKMPRFAAVSRRRGTLG